MKQRWVLNGFTIVELLIVIVIIGILATVTIVAYNGTTKRAQIAVLQDDLQKAGKNLGIYRASTASTDTYPIDNDCSATPAANTTCLRASNGTVLHYLYESSLNSFCVTGISGTTVYSISSTNSTPQTGGCTITNLVVNPSVESSANGWLTNSIMDASRIQVDGKWLYRGTRTTVGATGIYMSRNLPSTVQANTIYTASATLTFSITTSASFGIRRAGTTTDIFTTTVNLLPNVPQRVSVTGSVGPWSSVYISVTLTSGASGDWLNADEAMLTKGSGIYSYADGSYSSNGWSWNGTANESTSTGPAF